MRDSRLACCQPFRLCSCTLQSEGKIFLALVTFLEFRVSFHPYYYMTLGHNSLGLVVVLFSSLYLSLFLRKSSFTHVYTCCQRPIGMVQIEDDLKRT
jgi:hypothetical protein